MLTRNLRGGKDPPSIVNSGNRGNHGNSVYTQPSLQRRICMRGCAIAIVFVLLGFAGMSARAADFESKVKQGYVDSNGVKIHYATVGSAPLIVMIHGFPDYWYTWRKQMEG